jgi:hypothetical protein
MAMSEDELDAWFAGTFSDMDTEVAEVLRLGREHPLSEEESRALLTKIVDTVRESAERAGDAEALRTLSEPTKTIVDQIIRGRDDA